ncbi:unnamed protein product [Rhizoctonia solani]|uniref:Uncharacterized protein n=3 Tax=Rhizoctonia solani TaxID=456999 RepID=A0A8H3CQ13_9AGAM|nr:hypothetical protein RSOL_494500 [Rhizoctonia solani AG-3 Rhs1AP]KEP46188.1 hypothetical protein V565_213340 [Rhizoctonia solani 123E]CAE6337215.1 unnamed protein product [Rhizoctonia solani]CAE6489811.1 unnamed protein product [Rhizoctonia solani]
MIPDDPPEALPPIPFNSPLLPWVWTRHLYEPACELSDLGHRSSAPVVDYMSGLLDEHRLSRNSSSKSHMAPLVDDRLETILLNQYKRRMCKNRPRWYQGHPLDTAPKCFTSSRRNDVPLIRDWAACYRVIATKAAWTGKVFSHKYYEVNGVIWAWEDPATTLLVDLFASDMMDTVEFAISSDPFHAPHVVVTHSPGEEPEYLDTHGNPDQLTSSPSPVAPSPWGCTPRQSFTGPNGMDQLLLPPRMSMYYERDEYAELCAAATINRRNIFLRVSIQFQEGLRRARARRERGRDTNIKHTCITISDACSEETDLQPMTRDQAKACGFSDTDATESLMARGIMFQPRADDLALMAESAILSEESEDEDDDESMPMSPRSPTLGSDTYEVLRRLGMIQCDAEDEGEYESEEDDSEDEESVGDITIPPIPGFTTRECPWASLSSNFPSSSGSPYLSSIFHTETDEQSSVSSCFIDEDSFESGSETPDTDEDDC